eukprot:TRINITY_DN12784_c0_g1_i1.p1 TRINITY_DN12784_c0_g1~~TRINITY_DN12784_c0_g1_i1.p1  ORF type:complete len:246 (+),score=40.83 TRINITY_DN12784_c0_g1_i1:199-936(+)
MYQHASSDEESYDIEYDVEQQIDDGTEMNVGEVDHPLRPLVVRNNAGNDASQVSSLHGPPPIEDENTEDNADDDDLPPASFVCPISCDVMHNPVIAADGHTYEKTAITKWFTSNRTSPMTGAQVLSKACFPNHNLRSQIIAWKEEQGISVEPSLQFDRRRDFGGDIEALSGSTGAGLDRYIEAQGSLELDEEDLEPFDDGFTGAPEPYSQGTKQCMVVVLAIIVCVVLIALSNAGGLFTFLAGNF